MANLDLKYKINVPFADKGNRDDIPDTSSDGLVNNTDGLGIKYEQEIPEGGEYFKRETFNGILYKVYTAVKELQDFAITAGFPVDMTKALNILPITNGGTGANNAAKARENLKLGSLATKSTITSADITNGTIVNNDIANSTITGAKIANNTITDNKLSGTISVSHGGTGNDYGKSQYISNVDIYKLFGLKAGQSYTTQQLVDIIANNYNKYTGLMATSYIWTSGSSGAHIIDLPYNPSSLLIKIIDTNSIILRAFPAYDSYDFAIGVVNSGKFRGWVRSNNIDFRIYGRSINAIPPLISNNAVGAVISLGSETGTQKLPAGGTWFFYYMLQYEPDKNFHGDSYVGIQAGGTTVGVSGSIYRMNGWAIKIA